MAFVVALSPGVTTLMDHPGAFPAVIQGLNKPESNPPFRRGVGTAQLVEIVDDKVVLEMVELS